VPDSDATDVERAVQAARATFPAWKNTPKNERARLLNATADYISAHLEEFAQVESEDNGKPLGLARTLDIPRAVDNFRFFASQVATETMPCTFTDFPAKALHYTSREAVGVVGLITPWNLPLYLLTWKVAPALAMGNTVVAKPSELTPRSACLLAKALEAAGVPKGVFNVVHGLGAKAGAALVGHPDVPIISFTGGTHTGLRVAAKSAELLKKVSLELGGKNPTLVFEDCDLGKAVPGAARSAFLNQGEICLCGSRILVHRSIHDTFVARLVAHTAATFRVGDPQEAGTSVGALISKEHKEKVLGYIALAKEEGGRVELGGDCTDLPARVQGGYYVHPTIITGLPITSRVATEEIFGPVVTVHKFDTEQEAIEGANCVKYGLAGSVWSQDINRAHRVAAQVESGILWVNCWLVRDLRTPFGGVKGSGIGREGGNYSLDFYSEQKTITVMIGDPAPLPPAVSHLPVPAGAYVHARQEGRFIFLSGMGPRQGTNTIPGGAIVGADGSAQNYDVTEQAQALISNMRTVLANNGSSLERVVDVQVFLVDMKRDFAAFNKVYAQHFTGIQACRTTVSLAALPSPVAVQFKVVALAPGVEDSPAAIVHTSTAAKPVGAYPHARRVGDVVFLSGVGPRSAATNEIPGGPVWDAEGRKRQYDVAAQTEACIDNVVAVLKACDLDIPDVVDVQVYLIDLAADLEAFSRVFHARFGPSRAVCTTMQVTALPTPIAVELKVIARARGSVEAAAMSCPTVAPTGCFSPHVRCVDDLLFVSAVGGVTPSGELVDGSTPENCNIEQQTNAAVANLKAILAECGVSLQDVVDVHVFLVDMARNFAAFNSAYSKHFESTRATRTTVAVHALPGGCAVHLKVIARPRPSQA